MEFLLLLTLGLYSVTSILLAYLAYTYGKTALATRARYPTWLFLFALLLLAHSAGTAIWYGAFQEYIGDQAYPFMFGMGTFELVGVGALLKITL